jgi:CARDB
MRRVGVVLALLALAAPVPARAEAPPLRANLTACHAGPEAADRSAAFTASMPAVRGTERMWMRFDLQQRTPRRSSFATIRVPGLGAWKKSAPGRSGFIYDQTVRELAAPGDYRAVVRFRWYAANGELLRSKKRTTSTCRQPDQRPDLRAGPLSATTSGDVATYRLVVVNEGRGDAGPFAVGLTVGGTAQPPQRVEGGLGAGEAATVIFTAAPCAPGSTLRFTLDAQAEVAEASEADDDVAEPCPLAGGRAATLD